MNKKERQAAALKKAKQKKIIVISVCTAVVLLIGAFLIFNAVQQSKNRVYTDGHQTVTLHANGNFSATLAHETRNGTYTENEADGVITVTFVSDGKSAEGNIKNDVLTLPDEWQDDHGHGSKLKLK